MIHDTPSFQTWIHDPQISNQIDTPAQRRKIESMLFPCIYPICPPKPKAEEGETLLPAERSREVTRPLRVISLMAFDVSPLVSQNRTVLSKWPLMTCDPSRTTMSLQLEPAKIVLVPRRTK